MSKARSNKSQARKAVTPSQRPNVHNPSETPNKGSANRSLWFVLRVMSAFVLMGLLIAVLHWWGFNSYRDVAEWAEPGSHEALIYNDETYYLSGQIGKRGLTKSKYTKDKLLGQVKDDGTPVSTEPVTTAEPETEEDFYLEDPEFWEEIETETELESVIPPVGAKLFESGAHAYILYTVEDKADFLILLEEDGEYYLYYREGTPNPLDSD